MRGPGGSVDVLTRWMHHREIERVYEKFPSKVVVNLGKQGAVSKVISTARELAATA